MQKIKIINIGDDDSHYYNINNYLGLIGKFDIYPTNLSSHRGFISGHFTNENHKRAGFVSIKIKNIE